ncbi:hypothetical protein ACVMIH_007685 [Bradyrhizobium sp. USDA 4503]
MDNASENLGVHLDGSVIDGSGTPGWPPVRELRLSAAVAALLPQRGRRSNPMRIQSEKGHLNGKCRAYGGHRIVQ